VDPAKPKDLEPKTMRGNQPSQASRDNSLPVSPGRDHEQEGHSTNIRSMWKALVIKNNRTTA